MSSQNERTKRDRNALKSNELQKRQDVLNWKISDGNYSLEYVKKVLENDKRTMHVRRQQLAAQWRQDLAHQKVNYDYDTVIRNLVKRSLGVETPSHAFLESPVHDEDFYNGENERHISYLRNQAKGYLKDAIDTRKRYISVYDTQTKHYRSFPPSPLP